jgi:hypothetical protein
MSHLLVCLPNLFATGVNKIRNQDRRLLCIKHLKFQSNIIILSSIAVLVTKIKSRRFTPHAHLHLVDLASADSTHKTAILYQKAHATIFSIYKHISTLTSSF